MTLRRARRTLREAVVLPFRVYRLTLSPLFPRSCRFEPTCSAYAIEAIARHGVGRGVVLSARRLLRCHPYAAAGIDPVPALR